MSERAQSVPTRQLQQSRRCHWSPEGWSVPRTLRGPCVFLVVIISLAFAWSSSCSSGWRCFMNVGCAAIPFIPPYARIHYTSENRVLALGKPERKVLLLLHIKTNPVNKLEKIQPSQSPRGEEKRERKAITNEQKYIHEMRKIQWDRNARDGRMSWSFTKNGQEKPHKETFQQEPEGNRDASPEDTSRKCSSGKGSWQVQRSWGRGVSLRNSSRLE